MTREEAINIVKGAKQYLTAGNPIWDVKKIGEALSMAIEALTNVHNLHSGDLISREDAVNANGDLIYRADAIEAIQNAYCKPCKERGDDHNEVRCRACDYDNAIIQIDALPSAEAVHGEWIDIDNYYRMATCSHCHKVTMFEKWGEHTKTYDFCPNCGTDMRGEDE